jgi:hypothetical protein
MRLRVLAIVAMACLGVGREAAARTSTVVGGLTSASYLFTGEQNQNVFHQGAVHDAHFRAGGLVGVHRERPWYELRAGLFAGALIAAAAEGFRMPVAALDSAFAWRASRTLGVAASLTGTIEPLTSSRLRSTSVATTVGKPAILYNPTIEVELQLTARDRAALIARANAMYLLSDHLEVHGDDLAAATGVEAELFYGRSLGVGRTLEGRLIGRLMGAKARTNPPMTGVVGALAGYTYERHRLRVHAAAGLSRVLGFNDSHLFAVEPLLDSELAYETTRLDRLTVGASWAVRENSYIGGLPSRFVTLRGGFTQTPSERKLRGAAELSYEINKYGVSRVFRGERDADTMHTFRARGRLFHRLGGGFQLFADAEVAFGLVSLAQPTACAPAQCADRGFLFRGLAGLAYVLSERPRDEALLAEVW